MEKKKKKIKIWGRINLFETSVVGIPAYPDAHLSADSFSLIKALSESGDELNINKETQMPEDEVEDKADESQEPEESKEEKSEEKPSEPEKSVPVTLDDIKKIVGEALEKMKPETQRGLVMTEKEVKDELSKKSVGELAMMQGLFVSK